MLGPCPVAELVPIVDRWAAGRGNEDRRFAAPRGGPLNEGNWKRSVGWSAAIKAIGKLRTQQDVDRFWQLYTSELALVEDPEVAKAMIAYGEALKANKQGALGGLAIALAHRMRESLARSWGTDAWQMRAAAPAP